MISLQTHATVEHERTPWLSDEAAGPLVTRLAKLAPLTADERYALARLSDRAVIARAQTDLVRAGDAAETAILVLEGFACRYVMRETGTRQILALLLPGDLCDPDLMHLDCWDHGVATLSTCRVTRVSREALEDLMTSYPGVGSALRRAKLEAEARSRAWLTALGICSAAERMAHLLCEVVDRLHAVGIADQDSGPLPLTQVQLAECTGMTSVHVNRILQELRRSGLVSLKGGQLQILDRSRLMALAAI